jgi:integrase
MIPFGTYMVPMETTKHKHTRAKLTKRTVEAVKPDQERDRVIWDDEIPGFGLRVWPSGRRVYILKYRTTEGRQRKTTIGLHGPITAEQARTTALQWLGEAKGGSDPSHTKSTARNAPTIADLANRYMDEHAKVKKRPGSVLSDETLLRLHILPRLGSMKVNAIDRKDVTQLHHAMRDRPGAANRTIALLSKMFNLAEKWGLRPDGSNPCRHVEKNKERKIERFLSNDELARLGEVLNEVDRTQTEMPSVIPAIRLLLFTGCRLSEILTLRWDEVDLENQCLRLRESKTGAKVVYLPPPALEILENIEQQDENPFVIIGAKPGSHLVNLQKPWRRIRAKAGLEDVRIHDLRHSFASVAAASGLSLPMIGALLGHTQPQTTQRYAHLAADPMRQAAGIIGSHIASAIEPKKRVEK